MRIRLISACLFVVFLSACSTPKMMRVSDTMAIQDYVPPKAKVKPVEESVDNQAQYRAQEEAVKLSLSVRDTELTDVLFLLSKESNLPIVADKDVHGKVTVNISNKGIFEILDAVLKPLGYSAFVEDRVIRVSSPRLVSKTFHVNYIRGSRNSSSNMSASMAASTAASTQSSGQQAGTQSFAAGGTDSAGVRITTDDKSNFWKELTKGLEVLIFGTVGSAAEAGAGKGDKSGKKLIINEQSGTIFVKDDSDNMRIIQEFLNDVQNSVRRQVIIQAHIIEVSLNDDFSFGLDWAAIAKFNGGEIRFSQSLAPATLSNFFKIDITSNKVNALFDAMKEQGNLNVLSSPKILAINNQKALIKLTSREVSWISKTTVIPGTTNITETTDTPQIDEIGIFLDVTPQIDDEGLITMHIHPSISEKTGTSTPNNKNSGSSMPIIAVREVDTIVNARTGQTVVIAGLIKDKILETKRHVPLLGDIPFLGNLLFSQIRQEKTKTELVILLTPYVLSEQYVSEMTRESEERLLRMERKFQPVPQLDVK